MTRPRDRALFMPQARAAELDVQEVLEGERARRLGRRRAFRWLGWGAILALLGQWGLGFLGYATPKKTGDFGGTVTAGTVEDFQMGEVKVFRQGKFYISRVPEGFLALWWKCPHLGCTVPWKDNDPAMGGPPGQGDLAFAAKGRFQCPCHQSTYNRYGQIVAGPAPRPMFQFPLRIEAGKILVQTGPDQVIARSEARTTDATPL